MPTLFHYNDALKQGRGEFRAAMLKGEYPYPPVLENCVPDNRLNRGQDMGYTHIPMEFVVGTRTSGRTNAFARNFLPIMKASTEFAIKWDKMCQSQMDEGIRDPILAYEYLNRYYVQEGNKRVSVLKFCEADTVYAHVIRVLPESGEISELEEQLYDELIKFIKVSGVNYLELSKPNYARLQQLMGKQPEERWTDDDRREFTSIHYHFRKAYESLGGNKLTSTRGDALLAFIEVYGYPTLRNSTEDQIKELLGKAWEEVTLQQHDIVHDLKLDPGEEKKPGLFQVLSIGDKKTAKVAFIHESDCEHYPWTKAHEQGRKYAQRALGSAVQTTSYFNAIEKGPAEVMEQAVADGNTIIFTTSSRLQPAALRCAVEHPNLTILNCTQMAPHRYIRTYFVRLYEAKFVLGAIAGALTDSNKLGYMAYLNANVEDPNMRKTHIGAHIAEANAFALGAQMVNPRAKVWLEWYNTWDMLETSKRLTDRGIRLIASQDYSLPTDIGHGLCLFTDGLPDTLASPVSNWGAYYESLLRRILDKSLQSEYQESGKAVNYFWGMSSGALSVKCSERLPASVRNLARLFQDSISKNVSYPFELYMQAKPELHGELSMEQIVHMDWLAENIEGALPDIDFSKATE